MKKYIHVTKEVREKLMKIFGVTNVMVWNALTFNPNRGNSDLAKRIRCCAIQNGGIVMNELPEVETFHDHDNYMRQYLPNGAMIEVNKSNGDADVLFRGESVKHYENIFVKDIEAIQNWAATLR